MTNNTNKVNAKAPSKPAGKPPFPPKKPSPKAKAAATKAPVAILATLVSPKGKEYQVSNISAFARRFNLERSAVSRVASGQRPSHKNWTLKQG